MSCSPSPTSLVCCHVVRRGNTDCRPRSDVHARHRKEEVVVDEGEMEERRRGRGGTVSSGEMWRKRKQARETTHARNDRDLSEERQSERLSERE